MPLTDVCSCNVSAETCKNFEEILPYCDSYCILLKYDVCIEVNQRNDLQIYTIADQQAFKNMTITL